MSLCIAAIAKEKDADRVVICTDKQVSTSHEKAETETKGRIIAHDLMVLYAGIISNAHELVGIYIKHLNRHPLNLKNDDPFEPLRTPPQVYRQRQINELVQARLGISYDRFLKNGKKELDPEIFRETLFDISRIEVGVHLVICGFVGGKAAKVFLFDGVRVTEESHFACIGTGAAAAQHSLFRQGQDSDAPFGQTLYNVWEAKKFGELAPTVGERKTDILMLEPGFPEETGHMRFVRDSGKAFLDAQYALYGPKSVPSDFALPDGSLLGV
jgi:hypothetical protein